MGEKREPNMFLQGASSLVQREKNKRLWHRFLQICIGTCKHSCCTEVHSNLGQNEEQTYDKHPYPTNSHTMQLLRPTLLDGSKIAYHCIVGDKGLLKSSFDEAC